MHEAAYYLQTAYIRRLDYESVFDSRRSTLILLAHRSVCELMTLDREMFLRLQRKDVRQS